MRKITFKKMNMSQIWKNNIVTPVTLLKFGGKAGEEPVFSELKEGERVTVSGISKGRGFQGVVKRHGFHGGPKSHGQKNRMRAPGSIGPTAPQRTLKGRKMAGHMGTERITVKNLTVAAIDQEKKLVSVKGAVPGARGTIVEVRLK